MFKLCKQGDCERDGKSKPLANTRAAWTYLEDRFCLMRLELFYYMYNIITHNCAVRAISSNTEKNDICEYYFLKYILKFMIVYTISL